MKKVTADLSLLPLGTNTSSLSVYLKYVKSMLEKQEKVLYEMGPMSTHLEGDIDYIWEIVRIIQDGLFKQGLNRLYTVLKIDDRRDKETTLQSKRERLGL